MRPDTGVRFLQYFCVLLVLCNYTPVLAYQPDWSPVEQVLEEAIANGAFPGCVAIIGTNQGYLYANAFGNFTYGVPPPYSNGENPPMTLETLFDLASCTKVAGATTAIAHFYQRGELDLHTRVMDLGFGPAFAANGKANITVLNCLLHNAGYPPDPNPNYWDPAFGCPQTRNYHPQEDFSCQTLIYESLLNQTLENPIGQVYVYSDLSFITLQYVVGYLARTLGYITADQLYPGCDTGGPGIDQCYFEAYLREYVFPELSMKYTGFLPPHAVWGQCAPTENDTAYLHEVIQGQVSDGNAYALGGIAGHAGLFSNAPDLFVLMKRWLFADIDDPFLNATTSALFTREYNHTQSSRALGWNTNDPTVWDYGWNQTCGNLMAPTAWGHIGFTGTQVCADPTRGLITVLLTNRVYPNSSNYLIEDVRRNYNDAVVKVFDSIPLDWSLLHIEEEDPTW